MTDREQADLLIRIDERVLSMSKFIENLGDLPCDAHDARISALARLVYSLLGIIVAQTLGILGLVWAAFRGQG